MKKTILILFVFLSALSINAQEPVIKIYMNGGSAKQYKINDIAGLSFISSNLSYSMTVFQSKLNSKSDFDIKTIDSIEFVQNQSMNIIQSGITKSFIFAEIDSIIFTFNTCTEIQIGNQIWMCRNLDVSTYRNGDSIRHAVSDADWVFAGFKKEGAWCYYDNDPTNGAIYGKLYNWYAVNDSRGLAPTGWHVPSDGEWTILTNYLGGEEIAGVMLKETGTSHWLSPNAEATNSSGFTALPGGYRSYNGYFFDLSFGGNWWSASEYYDSYIWLRTLNYNFTSIDKRNQMEVWGYSVRCVRD